MMPIRLEENFNYQRKLLVQDHRIKMRPTPETPSHTADTLLATPKGQSNGAHDFPFLRELLGIFLAWVGITLYGFFLLCVYVGPFALVLGITYWLVRP